MEEIADKWKSLRLTEEEEETLELEEEIPDEVKRKGELSVVGKLWANRNIKREVLSSTMGKVWKISKAATFMEYQENMFIITFATEADKQKVMAGRPWLFDNSLLVLKNFEVYTQPQLMNFESEQFWVQLHHLPMAFMNEKCGSRIGNSLGKVIEVDVPDDGVGWGRFLRIKVELSLSKVLARGRTVNVQGRKAWIPLRYEKLPKMCFTCGRIVHAENVCTNDGRTVGGAEGDKGQFGAWLRAEITPRWKPGGSHFRHDKDPFPEYWKQPYYAPNMAAGDVPISAGEKGDGRVVMEGGGSYGALNSNFETDGDNRIDENCETMGQDLTEPVRTQSTDGISDVMNGVILGDDIMGGETVTDQILHGKYNEQLVDDKGPYRMGGSGLDDPKQIGPSNVYRVDHGPGDVILTEGVLTLTRSVETKAEAIQKAKVPCTKGGYPTRGWKRRAREKEKYQTEEVLGGLGKRSINEDGNNSVQVENAKRSRGVCEKAEANAESDKAVAVGQPRQQL